MLGSGESTGADLSDFIEVGRYGLEIDFEGLSWTSKTGNPGPFSNFATMLDVTSNKLTVYSQDVAVIEGEEAVFTINLSMAQDEDFFIDYELQNGSAKGDWAWDNDYQQMSGSVLIPAGETSVEVRVPVFIDDQNENVEGFKITFLVSMQLMKMELSYLNTVGSICPMHGIQLKLQYLISLLKALDTKVTSLTSQMHPKMGRVMSG